MDYAGSGGTNTKLLSASRPVGTERPVVGKLSGDSDRPELAALGLIVDGPSSTYCVEKLGIEMTVSSPEFSMRLWFAAFDFSERVMLVPLRSSES